MGRQESWPLRCDRCTQCLLTLMYGECISMRLCAECAKMRKAAYSVSAGLSCFGTCSVRLVSLALVHWRSLLQRRQQRFRTVRHGHVMLEHNVRTADFLAVEILVRAVVHPKRGTLQRNPGKQSARP